MSGRGRGLIETVWVSGRDNPPKEGYLKKKKVHPEDEAEPPEWEIVPPTGAEDKVNEDVLEESQI